MGERKRTKDLTAEEILAFNKEELKAWMDRIMTRLYKLVDPETYNRLATAFIDASTGGMKALKAKLIELVELIKARWQEEPTLHAVT